MSSSEARAVADLRRLGLVSNPTRDVAPVRAVLEGWAARHGVRLVDLDIDDPNAAGGRRPRASTWSWPPEATAPCWLPCD